MRARKRVWISTAAAAVMMLWAAGCEDGGGGLGDGHDFGVNNPAMHIALGDSITQSGYPAILAAVLGKPVVNLGVGGSQSSLGASRIAGALARYKPGYVLILYGANDVTSGQPFASTIANLRVMVQVSKANRSIPVVATLTPMYGSHSLWAGAVIALNGEIRAMAASEGVTVADLERSFGYAPHLFEPDGLHPTTAGQALIAQTFLSVLK